MSDYVDQALLLATELEAVSFVDAATSIRDAIFSASTGTELAFALRQGLLELAAAEDGPLTSEQRKVARRIALTINEAITKLNY